MTQAAGFTIGTALVWLGCALALRAVYLILQRISNRAGTTAFTSKLMLASIGAGASLLAGSILVQTGNTQAMVHGAWHIPLVWWIMPFGGWLQVAAVIGMGIALAKSFAATDKEVFIKQVVNAIVWVAVGYIGYRIYGLDPKNSISVLKGFLPFQPATAIAILCFAIAAVAAMAFTAHAARTRNLAKGIATHLALITGSILFGIPLVFLLIMSFKEDRDMSSPKGIVWVPRVQRTMPYFNKKDPLYETRHNGERIEATITSRHPSGAVKLDVVKPLALRGLQVDTTLAALTEIPRQQPLYYANIDGVRATGLDIEDLEDGSIRLQILEPESLKGREAVFTPSQIEPIRDVGLRWQNYTEALSYLPPESAKGLVFLKNTLIIAILSSIGTILSSSLAAYAFARMRFPGREAIFAVFLATMMLPSAVTMLPQFLIYRSLGWIDTLLPLWAPAFFGSALNIFMLRQFFRTIPMELEDAAKIDGCSHGRTFWSIMLPQIKPALAVIGVTTFLAGWNNFFGPLIYVNSPSKMPLSFALQLYMGDRGNEPGLMMAFATMTIIPILLLFFFAQRYFIEGVTLSGLGGK